MDHAFTLACGVVMAEGVKEQGWIIAARRRSGGTPWFTKALGTSTAAHVYWVKVDAEAVLENLELHEEKIYAIFPVEIEVKAS